MSGPKHRQWRQKLGITQDVIAREAGVPVAVVSALERKGPVVHAAYQRLQQRQDEKEADAELDRLWAEHGDNPLCQKLRNMIKARTLEWYGKERLEDGDQFLAMLSTEDARELLDDYFGWNDE